MYPALQHETLQNSASIPRHVAANLAVQTGRFFRILASKQRLHIHTQGRGTCAKEYRSKGISARVVCVMPANA